MKATWQKLTTAIPTPFLPALLLAAGFLAFVAWDQSHWWRVKEDYSFGWLVPVFVAFVVHDRWAKISAAVAACATDGSPRAAGWRNFSMPWLHPRRLPAAAALRRPPPEWQRHWGPW